MAKTATPAPVLAEKAPEPGEKLPEPGIKIAGLETLDRSLTTELKEAGDTVVEDYKPTAEELEKMAAMPHRETPQEEPPQRSTIIPPSIAARTRAEMERGRQITEQKTRLREKALSGG